LLNQDIKAGFVARLGRIRSTICLPIPYIYKVELEIATLGFLMHCLVYNRDLEQPDPPGVSYLAIVISNSNIVICHRLDNYSHIASYKSDFPSFVVILLSIRKSRQDLTLSRL